MPSKPLDLIFPIRGIDENWAYGRQPEGTTPDALNVVPVDSIDTRMRGGQRWGLSKYYSTQHNSSESLQALTSDVRYVKGVTQTLTEDFTATDGYFYTRFSDEFDHYIGFYTEDDVDSIFQEGVIAIDGDSPTIVNNTVVAVQPATPTADCTVHMYKTYPVTFSGAYSLSIKVTTANIPTDDSQQGSIFLIFRANPAYNNELYIIEIFFRVHSATYSGGGGPNVALITATLVKGTTAGMGAGEYESIAAYTGAAKTALEAGLIFTVDITSGGVVSLTAGALAGSPVTYSTTLDSYTEYSSVGFALQQYDIDFTVDDFVITGATTSQSERIYKITAVSGGDIYTGPPIGPLALVTNGTNALVTKGRIGTTSAFGRRYFCDGNPANYDYLTFTTDTISTWTPTAGTLPMGSDETAVSITAATPGTPSFTVAEDWSGRGAGDYLLVAGSNANDGYYTIVSTSGSGPTVITVNESIADNSVSGTIQYQNHACTMMVLYRGRAVMAGLATDPHNWFMSAAGDLLDWDYGATLSATMAVAGNNTDAGYCPDIITCLAPFSDDLMYIGGDHTLWIMRGDPADRGRLDNVSYQTGISGSDAYTFDPNGIFYFFGMGTIWRLAPAGIPESISRNRLDATFSAINLITHTVRLAWDNVRHGLHIFIVPSSSGATTHYFWDQRTDGFWPISYPNDHGPTCVHAYDGDNPDDSALLLGGWDGYIRYIDPSVNQDDGTTISSSILYPPIVASGILGKSRINKLTTVLDTNSDNLTLTAYAEETPQKAIEASTIRFVRTLVGGRTVILHRIAGNAIALKLSNSVDDTTWAVENIVAEIESTGRARKNQL